MSDSLLTIITVTFNNLRGLERTCQSVQQLQFRGFEHIVIDGKSSDGTVDYLRTLAGVRWVSEEDKGIYDAMNKGIKLATGRLTLFMNAGDEFYCPGALDFLLSLNPLEKKKLIFGSAVYFERDQEFSFSPSVGSIYSFLKQNPFCHQAVFYPTDDLRSAGGYVSDLKVSADFELTVRLFNSCGGLVVNQTVAKCELGGVSCQRRIQSLSDRLSAFMRGEYGAVKFLVYPSCFYYFVKLHFVDALEHFGLMWPYRRLRGKIQQALK